MSISFMFLPYWIFIGISPLLYMKDLGVSLAHFGYYQGALALTFAPGSLLYGIVIKNSEYNQKKGLYISIQIFATSTTIIALVTF